MIVLALAIVVLFMVVPAMGNLAVANREQWGWLREWLLVVESLQSVMMNGFIFLYVAFVGGCFASFLNVVAWRVPQGRSILGSSRCPQCNHALAMSDNIPVWGWLKNDGHCRHCHSPIAFRYIAVEMLLGGIFLALFVAEIALGGINLPGGAMPGTRGIENVLFSPQWPLILAFVFHATLMAILFTITLVAAGFQRLPWSILLIGAALLLTIMIAAPAVVQVPWDSLRPFASGKLVLPVSMLAIVPQTLAGALVGWLLGNVTAALFQRRMRPRSQSCCDQTLVDLAVAQGGTLVVKDSEEEQTSQENEPPTASSQPASSQPAIASFVIVGLALGWQSAIIVFGWWCLLQIVSMWIPRSSRFYCGCYADHTAIILTAAVCHLLSWRGVWLLGDLLR